MADFVGAIDQGTTSTRLIIFDRAGSETTAYPASPAVGSRRCEDELRANRHEDRRRQPSRAADRRTEGISRWEAAAGRTLDRV
ncbi:hypothetical protein [Actinoplanes siamensis]|uniref:Carbohydrate kinase FGGY N-terminal domain-containing protein n=1 Tax=Actinoplanes siamensis TaxID=1223317 RepID=A0A919N8X3_9ACTN|nr:hypothetical protein [Actinoplanes siamensis]GIF06672.1 hypothetical protein Asi03nite_42100 [Actinoplanes siamensis]